MSSATALSPAGFWYNAVDFAYIRAVFAGLIASASLLGPVGPALMRSSAARRVMFSVLMTRGHQVSVEQATSDLRGLVAARPALRTIIDGGFPFDREIDPAIPVTIAWGTHDFVLLPYQAARARRQLPGASHSWLPGCGHVPMSDDVERVADILLRGSSSERIPTIATNVA